MKHWYDFNELQNEELYLHADKESEIVKQILYEQKIFLNKDKYYFLEAIEEYMKFIELIAKYIKELKLDNNSIILSILLRKLIFDGYFSNNNEFIAKSGLSYFDVHSFEGMDIVNGKGCCRHLTGFNYDLFNKLGIYNFAFFCYYDDYGYTVKDVFSKYSNHAVNLIKYNDVFYAYDCYLNSIFKSIDGFTMLEIFDGGEDNVLKFFYKPSACVMSGNIYYDHAINMINILEENSKKKMISYDEFLQYKNDAGRIFSDNMELFDDLREDSKKYTKKIATCLYDEFSKLVDDYYS